MKRALVMASQIRGLTAADGDAARVAEALAGWGFTEIDVRTGARATRDGIVDGWRDLTARSADGDAAVVFFAGHGATFVNRDDDPGLPRRGHVLLPTDYDLNRADDYRGITSWELSLLLRDLTRATHNVTLLLDCCFAASMARELGRAIPRGLPHPVLAGLRHHLEALRDQGADFDALDPLGNPHAVRAFAAGSRENCWEYRVGGVPHGAFSEALVWALVTTRGTPVTWRSIVGAIRARVARSFSSQRPEFAGPLGRTLFSTEEPAPSRGFAVAVTDHGQIIVRAGRLRGVQPGDSFRVVAPATDGCPDHALATAIVSEARATESVIDLQPSAPLPDGALAIPLTQQLEREPVAVVGRGPAAARLRARLAAEPRLAVVGARARDPMLSIRVTGGRATLADPHGPLLEPVAVTDPALEEIVAFASDLTVARTLRALRGDHGVAPASCAVAWGVIGPDGPRDCPPAGTLVSCGDRVYVRVTNIGPTPLYVHVFDVGTRGTIARLTWQELGVPLAPGERHVVGGVLDRPVAGWGLRWPPGLPTDRPRREELYAIATVAPIDLGVLETAPAPTRSRSSTTAQRHLRDPAAPALARLAGQLRLGGARRTPTSPRDGFAVHRIELMLDPGDAPTASGTFLADDNPQGTRAAMSAAAWRTRAEPPAAHTLAIELEELVVHAPPLRDRADLRFDALVCTRAAQRSRTWAATTVPLRADASGGRPRLDRIPLFRGQVGDFVDLCLWISPAQPHVPPLRALLDRAADELAVQRAAAVLASPTSPTVSCVGASLALARKAHDLLLGTLGHTIGLYRTCFLADDRYLVGRHSAPRIRRVGEFSFAVITEDATP